MSVDVHTYALYIRSMITHHIVYYNNHIDIDMHICIGRYVDWHSFSVSSQSTRALARSAWVRAEMGQAPAKTAS